MFMNRYFASPSRREFLEVYDQGLIPANSLKGAWLYPNEREKGNMAKAKPQDIQDKMLNGVNLTQLGNNITAIRQQPDLAKFKFRAQNKWVFGGHNQVTIGEFYGTNQRHRVDKTFQMDADEPPVLLGEDKGPNPVEYVLTALSACMTTTLAYHAAARGYRIDSIESEYEGDLDLQGFLCLRQDVRKGYQNIRVKFTVKGDIPKEVIKELVQLSPVHDVIANGVPISINVEKQ
jgi:uncharacterized OsmC-like protein